MIVKTEIRCAFCDWVGRRSEEETHMATEHPDMTMVCGQCGDEFLPIDGHGHPDTRKEYDE